MVEPGSVQVPATHWEAAGAVVAQPVAQVVEVVPGSQAPATVDPLELELELVDPDPPVALPDAPFDALPDAPLADDPVETAPPDVSPPPDAVDAP